MTHFDQKSTSSDEEFWNRSGLLILGVRLVQGWIFFSAGIRRLFYAPAKLDTDSAAYVGNKLVHAMPGALFGIERIIDAMLQMPVLTDLALWIWTLAELLVGASLMLGLMSRLSGALSILFSVNVMLVFGWMGSTCLDEWTMAVSNFAMGTAIVLAGGGTASIDYLLMKRRPRLAERPGFVLTASGSLSWKTSGRWPLWLGILSFLFAVGFYHLLFGGGDRVSTSSRQFSSSPHQPQRRSPRS